MTSAASKHNAPEQNLICNVHDCFDPVMIDIAHHITCLTAAMSLDYRSCSKKCFADIKKVPDCKNNQSSGKQCGKLEKYYRP